MKDIVNSNITEFSNGLYTDSPPIKQPKGTQRFALNALKEYENVRSNENSNEKLNETNVPLIVGDILLGKIYLGENLFALFIVSYKNSLGNDLAVPISKIALFNTETEILTIEVSDEDSTDKLNFKAENQIQGIYRLRRGCERTIYFVQKDNPPRYYNFDKSYDFKDEADVFVGSKFTLLKTYKKYPTFERLDNDGNIRFGLKVVNGGKLLPGSDNVCFRYVDEDFNSTEWITTTEPVVIYHKDFHKYRNVKGTSSSKAVYQNFGETDKALEISIKGSSLDLDYPCFQLGLIESSGMSGEVNKVSVSPMMPIQKDFIGIEDYYKYTFTGASSYGESSEREVLAPSLNIESAKTITQKDNKLLLGKVEGIQVDWCKLQKYASKIETRVVTKDVTLKNLGEQDNPANPEAMTESMTFMPGEIYSIGIVWDFEGGFTSPVYHIPGVYSQGGNAIYRYSGTQYTNTLPFDTSNICEDITYVDNYNCGTTDSYWGKDSLGTDLEDQKVRHHRFPLRSIYDKKPVIVEEKEGINNLPSYEIGTSHKMILWVRSKKRNVNRVFKKHFNDFTIDVKIKLTNSKGEEEEHTLSRTINIGEWEASRRNNIKINEQRGGWFAIELGLFDALDENVEIVYISEQPQLFERSSGDGGTRYGWATSGGWWKCPYTYGLLSGGWNPDEGNAKYPSETEENLGRFFNTYSMGGLGHPAYTGYTYWGDSDDGVPIYCCSVVNMISRGSTAIIGGTALTLFAISSGDLLTIAGGAYNLSLILDKRGYEMVIEQNDDLDVTGQDDIFTQNLFGIKLYGIEVPSLEDTNGHKIIGYHLVANKRDEDNKTILDSAITFPMFQNRVVDPTYSAYCFHHPIQTSSTPVYDQSHLAFINPDYKFFKKQYKDFTFIPQFLLSPRGLSTERYYSYNEKVKKYFSLLKNFFYISNTNTFKPNTTQSAKKTNWILEDVQGGTTYDPSTSLKKEEDYDGFQLYNLVREIPLSFKTPRDPNKLNTNSFMLSFKPQSVDYISPLESIESEYTSLGSTAYTSVYNLSSDNNIGVMTLKDEDKTKNSVYLNGFVYGLMKRDISNPYGLFRLLPYYNISKNIVPVTYNEVTSTYQYSTTHENFGGDVFITPMKYVNSLFYDIRNRRRKRKNGIWSIIGGSLAVIASTVVFVLANVFSWGIASAITPLYISAMSAGIGLIINGIRIQHANTVYTQLYQLGLKDCIDDQWSRDFLKKPNPEDDQVQWVHEILNSLWFESSINMFWRITTNGYVNNFLDPLGKYSLNEYCTYFQNKLTVLDTEHKDGRLYIGFCKAEYYEANLDYLRRNYQKRFYHLPLEYDCCSKCLEKFPNRIYYSETSFQEEKTDNYRKFLPNNYKELGEESGEITNIFVYDDKLFVHTKEALYIVPSNIQEKIVGDVVAYVGTGEFLSLPAIKVIEDSTGLSAGSQHQWGTLITNRGVLFIDEHSKSIYLYSKESGLLSISSLGEEKWFNENTEISQNILYRNLYGEEYPYKDNPSSDFGNGYISTYDKENNRFIITKKDSSHTFELETGDLADGFFIYDNKFYPKHTASSKFIIDNTPSGYTFSHIDEETATAIYTKTEASSNACTSYVVTPFVPGEDYYTLSYNILWKYRDRVVDSTYVIDNYNITLPATISLNCHYDNTDDELDLTTFPYTTSTVSEFKEAHPTEPIEGTVYYNTYDNKIYTFTSGNWDAGVVPSLNIHYYNESDKKSYSYNGTELVLSFGFNYEFIDTCVPLVSESSFDDLTETFEDLLGDSLNTLTIDSHMEGVECPYKKVIDIIISLDEVENISSTICKEWYKYIEEIGGVPVEIPYYELITDEEELLALSTQYKVTIFVYNNRILFDEFELPTSYYDNCNNLVLDWCHQLNDYKSTDVITIYEEIRDRETDELVYGWFQELVKDDEGNYTISNKPKHCEDPGGGDTQEYFNIIINKCFECEGGGCLPEMDVATFKVTFVQKDLVTHEVIKTYPLYRIDGNPIGKVIVPLTCSNYSVELQCCLKTCGSGAHPYTEDEVNTIDLLATTPFTWDEVEAAFLDVAAGGTLGWEVLIEEEGADNCTMQIDVSLEPLNTTLGPSFLYTISNVCDCCIERYIDVVKIGTSWGEEVFEAGDDGSGYTHALQFYIGASEIQDIEVSSYPLHNKGMDMFGAANITENYHENGGVKFFTRAMIWENIHISCDVFESLEAIVNTNGNGLFGMGDDTVYQFPPYNGTPGQYDLIPYLSSYVKVNPEGKITIYIFDYAPNSNNPIRPDTDPPVLTDIIDLIEAAYVFTPLDCDTSGLPILFALGGLIEGECTCIDDTDYTITEVVTNIPTEITTIETVPLEPIESTILDNSWTKSFDIKEKNWISYHSYLPNFYIHNNKSFYSYKNNITGLWKHNIIGEFQTFYGTTYPYILDYVSSSSPLTTRMWEYLHFIVDAQTYDAIAQDYVDINNEFFDKIILYNSRQCSGELTINVKRNDVSENFFINQLTDGQTGEILADRVERNWFINNIRDRRTDYSKPIFLKNLSVLQSNYFIDKIVDATNIDLEKDWTELENFRDKYLQIRLIFSNFADETNTPKNVKLLMNFIIEEEKVSLS